MQIVAQFDPEKTSDPATFRHEFHSRLYVAFPGAKLFVHESDNPVILVSGAEDEADRKRIIAKVERQRDSIGF